MKIPPQSTMVFIGDSITAADRDPSGEATPWNPAAGLGRGYVSLVDAWFGATQPGSQIRLINRGVNGHTVRDLEARWQTDVMALKPDWVAIMIGINDVWRQFDTPLRRELAVGPDEFAVTLRRLVALTRPKVKGLVLITPYFIEPNRDDPMRRRMDEYGALVKSVAADTGALLVDAQAAFDDVLAHTHPMTLAWDRIHPNTTGHLILARSVLRTLDLL